MDTARPERMPSKRRYDMTTRSRAAASTRDRILEAAREHFFPTPYDEVTLAAIARTAGTSSQTLLNHFGSKEGLFAALVERVGAEIEANREAEPADDVRSVVEVLVRQFEEYGDVNARLAALEDRIPAVATALELGRDSHRTWLATTFAADLPSAPDERRASLDALHVVTDVYAWKLLRRDLGLSRERTAEVMERTLRAVLNHR